MREKHKIELEIPEGINCEYVDDIITCKKGNIGISKKISIIGTDVKISGNMIIFECMKANKKNKAIMKSNASHVNNILKGFDEKYVYKLEICNVHFPMTVKVEGKEVVISNFLGEKINRVSEILEGVEVEIKGKEISVSSSDKEAAGQTCGNIEKATRVINKDRRIFQDGCFITSKPGNKAK